MAFGEFKGLFASTFEHLLFKFFISECASSTSSMQNSERFGSVEGGIQVITQKEQIQALVLALEQVEASTLLPAGEPIAESFFPAWLLEFRRFLL